eukprot:UN08691
MTKKQTYRHNAIISKNNQIFFSVKKQINHYFSQKYNNKKYHKIIKNHRKKTKTHSYKQNENIFYKTRFLRTVYLIFRFEPQRESLLYFHHEIYRPIPWNIHPLIPPLWRRPHLYCFYLPVSPFSAPISANL